MPDLEKVIRGLELCVATVKDCDPCPTECPYYGKCMGNNGLFFDLMEDALQLMSDPDRVRVVRCRDCVEWEAPTKAEQREGETFGHCRCRFGNCYGQLTDMNWFCAGGERSE